MLRPGKIPAYPFILLGIGLIAAAEGSVFHAGHKRAGRARTRLERTLREREKFASINPAATEGNARAIEADLVRAREVLATWQAELNLDEASESRWRDQPVPPERIDAFLDLAAFVERMRGDAARSGVALKSDERFSFSAFAVEGPTPGTISAVFDQKIRVQSLLAALFSAHPRRLLSVQREVPVVRVGGPASAPGRPQASRAELPSTDLFVMDPGLSSREAGLVEAMAFRVVFVGPTGTLRAFLAELARRKLPVAARLVEVEPAAGSDVARNEPAASGPKSSVHAAEPPVGAADELELVVAPALSKFTVTVEFIGLAPAAGQLLSPAAVHPAA
jgi:hypothetical protein